MTMTSVKAGHLRRALKSRNDDLARALNWATTKTTYAVWTMNAITELMLSSRILVHTPVVPTSRPAVRPIPRDRPDRSRARHMGSVPTLLSAQTVLGAISQRN